MPNQSQRIESQWLLLFCVELVSILIISEKLIYEQSYARVLFISACIIPFIVNAISNYVPVGIIKKYKEISFFIFITGILALFINIQFKATELFPWSFLLILTSLCLLLYNLSKIFNLYAIQWDGLLEHYARANKGKEENWARSFFPFEETIEKGQKELQFLFSTKITKQTTSFKPTPQGEIDTRDTGLLLNIEKICDTESNKNIKKKELEVWEISTLSNIKRFASTEAHDKTDGKTDVKFQISAAEIIQNTSLKFLLLIMLLKKEERWIKYHPEILMSYTNQNVNYNPPKSNYDSLEILPFNEKTIHIRHVWQPDELTKAAQELLDLRTNPNLNDLLAKEDSINKHLIFAYLESLRSKNISQQNFSFLTWSSMVSFFYKLANHLATNNSFLDKHQGSEPKAYMYENFIRESYQDPVESLVKYHDSVLKSLEEHDDGKNIKGKILYDFISKMNHEIEDENYDMDRSEKIDKRKGIVLGTALSFFILHKYLGGSK